MDIVFALWNLIVAAFLDMGVAPAIVVLIVSFGTTLIPWMYRQKDLHSSSGEPNGWEVLVTLQNILSGVFILFAIMTLTKLDDPSSYERVIHIWTLVLTGLAVGGSIQGIIYITRLAIASALDKLNHTRARHKAWAKLQDERWKSSGRYLQQQLSRMIRENLIAARASPHDWNEEVEMMECAPDRLAQLVEDRDHLTARIYAIDRDIETARDARRLIEIKFALGEQLTSVQEDIRKLLECHEYIEYEIDAAKFDEALRDQIRERLAALLPAIEENHRLAELPDEQLVAAQREVDRVGSAPERARQRVAASAAQSEGS
jgi:hypothetical protein